MSADLAVERLGWRDERAAVATLAAAFADYDLVTALCPDPRHRPRVAEAFVRFLLRVALRSGEVYATADRAAVACALPPGREWPPEWAFVRAGVLSLVWRLGVRRGWHFLRLGPAFDRTRSERMADRPHWYVSLLGVRPDAQGKGLSRSVLRPIFDAADRAAAPVFLETMPEGNVAIYRRLGFELVGKSELPGGLPNWELLREPAGVAQVKRDR